MRNGSTGNSTRWLMKHFGLPLAVLGCSILVGGGLSFIVKPGLQKLSQGDMTSRMLAVEVVSPAETAPLASTPAHPVTASVAAPQATAASEPTPAIVSTSLEPASTTAVLTPAEPQVTAAPEVKPQVSQKQSNQPQYRYFNGRRIRPARTMTMVTTAYSPDERSCGPDANGTTASGLSVWTNGMKMVAADTRILPFGTLVSIPGYYDGQPVPVLDRGGAIKGNRLDLLYPTHERAMQWGKKRQTVTIWEYVD